MLTYRRSFYVVPLRTVLVSLSVLVGGLAELQAEPPVARADGATGIAVREIGRFQAAEAIQAVAVDASSIYAITNRAIGRYAKQSRQPIVKWTSADGSPIQHLNSGIVLNGKLYCANSNWPRTPLKNSIEIFDAESLRHLERRHFEESKGAINWIERRDGAWWIVFAHYGDAAVRQTRLVRYNDEWEQTGKWSFPEQVVRRFLPNSNSGGAFGPNGRLYVTGHDHAELYVLRVPAESGELIYVETVAAPIAGQGIAWDRSDIGSLYGLVRKSREIVHMRLTHADEYQALRQPVRWVRDANNPILAPRPGQFDATRCMNPWVVRVGEQYRLYYSGGDRSGAQRLAVATADVSDLSDWKRSEPLLDTGGAGQFDARWCVLPHVVRMPDRWHMYYTGNAGRGSGLSAFPGIGLAISSEGDRWKRYQSDPVLAASGQQGDPDAIGIAGGSVIDMSDGDSPEYWFYYTGCPTVGKPHHLNQQKTICLAVSTDGIQWHKRGAVMLRDPDRDYENIGVAGPVVHREADGTFRMWYSAIGSRWGYYCICYAESRDGIHWSRGARSGENLQLAPDGDGWEQQMVEYPSVIREGDHLRLFYCGNGYGRTGIGTAVSISP